MSTIYSHHCCCRSLCCWSEVRLTLPKCWCLICGWYGHMKVLQKLCGAFPLDRPLTREDGLDFCHSALSLSQPAQQLGSGVSLRMYSSLSVFPKMTWMWSFSPHLKDTLNILAWQLVECELLRCSPSLLALPSLSIPLLLWMGATRKFVSQTDL